MKLRKLFRLAKRGRISDHRSWQYADKDDGSREWPVTEFLSEDHHRLYGRPWSAGRAYFNYIFESGLKRSDVVLDFGCGAGRTGIWLIPYLDKGNYFGVDNHRYAIEAFRSYEVPLHGLQEKSSTILLDPSGEPHGLGKTFDVILDLWVTRHFSRQNALKTYRSFCLALSDRGSIFTNDRPLLGLDELADLGLHVVRNERRPNWKKDDVWHVLQKLTTGGVVDA
jgi:SAM-dependent methyltransferase